MFRFLAHKIINLAILSTISSLVVLSFPLMSANSLKNNDLTKLDYLSSAINPSSLNKKLSLLAQKQDRLKRVALVIGNANYQDEEKILNNPINDANDVAAKLKEVGFEVILITDGNQREMDEGLDQFYQKLTKGGVGLFFYAGHGIQVDGENYLIPIDATLKSKIDVKYETLALMKVLQKMYDAESEVKIMILDACRDNPFARNWKTRSSSQTRGLAPVQSKHDAKGEFIAYATQPGNVALDGDGRNGIFTYHLLQHLTSNNKTIEEVFKLVRRGVAEETDELQVPFVNSGLIGDFYFNGTEIAKENPQSVTPPQEEALTTNSEQLTRETDSRPLTLPSMTINNSSTEVALNSSRGIDYKKLRDLLEAGKSKEADQETSAKILEIANRENEGWLRPEDTQNLSCEDLNTLNQLWFKYSNGEFYFSAQQVEKTIPLPPTYIPSIIAINKTIRNFFSRIQICKL